MTTQTQTQTQTQTGADRVKRSLLAQLDRIEDFSLTEEQFNLKERRSKVINGITGNLIKISALSLKAVELKQRHHQLGLNDELPKLDNLMG